MTTSKIQTFQQALDYLFTLPRSHKLDRESIFGGEIGIKRTKSLLQRLDNPQDKLKVIHIAGTSGKGSTAFITSQLIKNSGLKVGLYEKPHLIDLRERFQVNNQLISHAEFIQYVRDIQPHIEIVRQQPEGLSWYEAITCLAFYIFWRSQVDYAVIETGLGGLLDASNVVTNPSKIAVITTIGYDHTEVLGETLPEISAQKAGIIQPGNTVFMLRQSDEIDEQFIQRSESVGASIHLLDKNEIVSGMHNTGKGSVFSFSYQSVTLKKVLLSMKGEFQIDNTVLGLAVLEYLSLRDGFSLSAAKITQTLATIQFHGRYEELEINKKHIILDSAHNPQKMAAFLSSLDASQKYDFVLAFKKSKDYKEMLRQVAMHAHHIYLTNFQVDHQDFVHGSEDPEILLVELLKFGYKSASVVSNSSSEWKKIIDTSKNILVFTGSMYLLSSVYLSLKHI